MPVNETIVVSAHGKRYLFLAQCSRSGSADLLCVDISLDGVAHTTGYKPPADVPALITTHLESYFEQAVVDAALSVVGPHTDLHNVIDLTTKEEGNASTN